MATRGFLLTRWVTVGGGRWYIARYGHRKGHTVADKTKKESPWVEALAHAEKLLQLVKDSAPRGEFPVTAVVHHIVGMLRRALRLYDGVLVLLKAELPEEAAILARSLFEVSLRLQQLKAEPHNRNALIFDWVSDSITQQHGLLRVGKSCGLDADIDEVVARLEEQRKENRKYASELGVTRFQSFLTVKDAAFRFDRKKEYWSYEWAHESVHSTDAAWMFAKRRPAADTIGLYAKTGDPMVLSHFARFAARSMADATKAVFTILDWTLAPGLEQTVTDIEAVLSSNAD